jgi:hypothetical protein
MLKAWHTHNKTPHGGADFYPLLGEVGKCAGYQTYSERAGGHEGHI